MTPEEIRDACLEKIPKVFNQSETLIGIFCMLREIAAQLAEINLREENARKTQLEILNFNLKKTIDDIKNSKGVLE